MPKDTREPREILAHVTKARVGLTSVIYGLSEVDLVTEGVVGKWSVKDLMAHVGRWESVCFDVLQKHLHGEQVAEDYRDATAYNDKWEAELRALTLQESIELFETAHYRLFGLLSALTPEQWNGYVRAWTMGSTWHHFEEHAEQIRAWRAARFKET
jgi:DinB superfamily